MSKFRRFVCLVESQIVSSVKNEETLLHDDHREEKVAYKDEDDAERLESKSVSVDQGVNCCCLNV